MSDTLKAADKFTVVDHIKYGLILMAIFLALAFGSFFLLQHFFC